MDEGRMMPVVNLFFDTIVIVYKESMPQMEEEQNGN